MDHLISARRPDLVKVTKKKKKKKNLPIVNFAAQADEKNILGCLL